MNPARDSKGFSLLELSVVLVVISIIMVFGLDIATSAMRGSDRIATQERMVAIQKALDGFVRANGYLPCPYSRSIVPGSASYGVENRNSATRTECFSDGAGMVRIGSNPSGYIGGVPVRTLGLPDSYGGDAWGNKFTYAVSGAQIASASSYREVDSALAVRTGDRTGTNYMVTTGRTDADGNGSLDPAAGASYVIISHGPDGKGAFPLYGTSATVPCGSSSNNDVENCDDGNLIFYDSLYNDGNTATTFFDDYVVWGSNSLQRSPTPDGGIGNGCSGTCALWCAPCDPVYLPLNEPYTLCKRTLVNASPCRALCEYAYPEQNIPCP